MIKYMTEGEVRKLLKHVKGRRRHVDAQSCDPECAAPKKFRCDMTWPRKTEAPNQGMMPVLNATTMMPITPVNLHIQQPAGFRATEDDCASGVPFPGVSVLPAAAGQQGFAGLTRIVHRPVL